MSIAEAVEVSRKSWDADAKVWERLWVPVFQRFGRDLVYDARVAAGGLVLDLGTGTGVAALEAAREVWPGGFVLGIDRSASMLATARQKSRRTKLRNLRFAVMNGENLMLPNGLFDAVVSNCGISYITLPRVVKEAWRVLPRGGVFVYSDWYLNDVPAIKIFNEVLERHRTDTPTKELSRLRASQVTLERLGNRYRDVKQQWQALERAGFRNIHVRWRDYKIRLPRIDDYLRMRVARATVRAELRELSRLQRRLFLNEVKNRLKRFARKGAFRLDWKIHSILGTKPR